MNVELMIGLSFIAMLVVACVYVMQRPPTAADERRANEESRVRAQMDMADVQRRRGYGGH